MSHLLLFKIANYQKLLGIGNCVVNLASNHLQKIQILKSSLIALVKLRVLDTKVAIIASAEMVNPSMQATTDAKEIVDTYAANPIHPATIRDLTLYFRESHLLQWQFCLLNNLNK
jgi:phosphotransacetylase